MRFPPEFGGYTQRCNVHSPSGNRRLLPQKGIPRCNSVILQSLDFGRESENQKITSKPNQSRPSNPIVHPLFVRVWFRNLMSTAYMMSHAKHTMYDMCNLPRPGFETGRILFATAWFILRTSGVGLVCVLPLALFCMMRGCLVPWVLLFGHFVVFGSLTDNPESRCHFSQHVISITKSKQPESRSRNV